MSDRLQEIKERLGLAATHDWTMVENNWSTTTIYSGDSSICSLQLDEEFEEDEDVETYIEDQRNTALFITSAPSDIAWLIAELEKERAENARLLDINHGLQMQLDEHLGEQPKVCADCITNYHTICQWEIEYKPGCVCGCHLTRVID